MSSNQTAQQVLWIDPAHSLSAHEHAKLLEAGLVPRSVHTLLDLKTAMTEQPSTPVVLLHDKTHGLLAGMLSFFLPLNTLPKTSLAFSASFPTPLNLAHLFAELTAASLTLLWMLSNKALAMSLQLTIGHWTPGKLQPAL